MIAEGEAVAALLGVALGFVLGLGFMNAWGLRRLRALTLWHERIEQLTARARQGETRPRRRLYAREMLRQAVPGLIVPSRDDDPRIETLADLVWQYEIGKPHGGPHEDDDR